MVRLDICNTKKKKKKKKGEEDRRRRRENKLSQPYNPKRNIATSDNATCALYLAPLATVAL